MRTTTLFFTSCVFLLGYALQAQTVANGSLDANAGVTWGLSSEIRSESIFGGPSGTNRVGEIDGRANLIQVIPGFTLGEEYTISFDVFTRDNICAADTQTMEVAIDTTVFPVSKLREPYAQSFETLSFDFVATQDTTLTLSFVSMMTQTCGLLVDNIMLMPKAPLPVELSHFAAAPGRRGVVLDWGTASELDNDYFSVERSRDGSEWETIGRVAGAGNSSEALEYEYWDEKPFSGVSYYRLRQVDFDGRYEYSPLRRVKLQTSGVRLEVFPNPTRGEISVSGDADELEGLRFLNVAGQDVTHLTRIIRANEGVVVLDLSQLREGVYYVKTMNTASKVFVR